MPPTVRSSTVLLAVGEAMPPMRVPLGESAKTPPPVMDRALVIWMFWSGVDWAAVVRAAAELPQLLSPWAVPQVPLLASALASEEGVA